MTVEEYLVISEADPRWTELIDGELVVAGDPRFPHARLQASVIGAVEAWRSRVGAPIMVGGPTGASLGLHDYYSPDVVICSSPPALDDRGYLAELPRICVEIRSPTTWHIDVGRKKATYEARGVPELWLVDDVARTVLGFRRSAPAVEYYDIALELRDMLTSPLLPGFELALAELFEP